MGLILRTQATDTNTSGITIKNSALSYAEGDSNFIYLLSNMSGSNTITGNTTLNGNLAIPTGYQLTGTSSYASLVAGNGITVNGMTITSNLVTVNGNSPTNGNVTVSLTGVITGLSSSLIVSSSGYYTGSFTTGSIWVVSGETATAFTSSNGRAYIFTTTGSPSRGVWQQIAPLDQTAADARYLQLAGGTMNGDISFSSTYKLNGTASWADNTTNSLTASYVTSSKVYGPYGFNSIVSASYASGSTSASYALTASYALNAGAGTGFPFSGSAIITGSLLVSGSGTTITGSLNVSSGITGSLFGSSSYSVTSSYILNAVSASYVSTASYVLNAISSSYVASSSYALSSSYSLSSSYVASASYATSASYVVSASYATSASYVISSSYALSSSYVASASYATSASYVISSSYALTSSYVNPLRQNVIITGSLTVTGSVSSSYIYISSSGNQQLRVFGSGSSNPIVSVQGSLGELFSVTDNLSGSLFSVNDISGLPILEVFSDNTTLIGGYSSPALNTTVKTTITTGVGQIIYQVPTSSYDAIFVDYIAKSGSSGNIGNFMATYSGSTAYSTFTSSSYVGGASFRMNAIITGSNLAITGSATTTGWTVKTIIRSI